MEHEATAAGAPLLGLGGVGVRLLAGWSISTTPSPLLIRGGEYIYMPVPLLTGRAQRFCRWVCISLLFIVGSVSVARAQSSYLL